MHYHRHVGADVAPGLAAPDAAALTPEGTTPAIAGPALLDVQGSIENGTDCAGCAPLSQLHRERVIVSMLYGATLRGFCMDIEKALGVQHG